jgi:hypothetical protein
MKTENLDSVIKTAVLNSKIRIYHSQNHLTKSGVILLIAGSILLGIGMGTLGYFVSGIYYLLFVYPIALGFVSAMAYIKLIQLSKVRHGLMTTFLGLITGLLVGISFFYVPYILDRNDYVSELQKKYQVSKASASVGLDNYVFDETDSRGFLGYMKLRARAGDDYTQTTVINSVPVHSFGFTIKSTWAWLYWLVEMVLILFPVALVGSSARNYEINTRNNEWYDNSSRQIGAVSIHDKDHLLALLKENDLKGISELVVSDVSLSHPMIELYRKYNKIKKSDVLLTVKETYRNNRGKIKSRVIGQWEVPYPDYEPFAEIVQPKFDAVS